MEHVPHNPNMVIDGVQRTLKYVEVHNNGVLPDALYLQFDNCLRENKNAYVCSFLANLIERGVFKCIYMSFLPVGHTHDICDQVNSRLSVACKRQNILIRESLYELMRGSYTPTPTVVSMDAIADWKILVNPDLDPHYGGPNSLVFEHSGILEPLLFRFAKDVGGRAGFQSKLTVDEQDWSTFFYPFRVHPSGVDLDKLVGNDAYDVGADRLAEIEEHVRSCEWRESMNEDVMTSLMDNLDTIRNPPMECQWLDGGRFAKENKEEYPQVLQEHEDDVAVEEEKKASVRPTHIFTSSYQRNKYSQKYLEVGAFVVVDVRRRHQDVNDVLPFFIGKVQSIDVSTRSCHVRWWNSSTNEWGIYRLYNGREERFATVPFSDLLCRFDKFSSTTRILGSVKKAIEAQLDLPHERRISIVPPPEGE